MLIPWPLSGHHYDDVLDNYGIRLQNILTLLMTGTFLKLSDGTYAGPPGYTTELIAPNSDESSAYAFSQKNLAIYIGSLARGLKRPPSQNTASQMLWRTRYAHQWCNNDPEIDLFPDSRNRNRNFHLANEQNNNVLKGVDMEKLQNDINFHINNLEENEANHNDKHSKLLPFMNDLLLHYSKIQINDDIHISPTVTSTNGTLNNGDSAFDTFDFQSPASIAHIVSKITSDPSEEFTLDVNKDTRTNNIPRSAKYALDQLMSPGNTSKPNEQQLALLTHLSNYFDNIKTVTAPLIFLEGAGGTGKSYIFNCIEKMAHAIQRNISVSALTGVACTAINTKMGARTTASLFKLGIAPRKLTQLQAMTKATAQHILGNPVVIIIDEFSFAQPSLLSAIDTRLKELAGN